MPQTNVEYMNEWFDSLTKEQKARLYSGDDSTIDEWWIGMPMQDKYMLRNRFEPEFLAHDEEELVETPAPKLSPVPKPVPVKPVIKKKVVEVRPMIPTPPPTANVDIKTESLKLTTDLNKPAPKLVTPFKLGQPIRTETPKELIPDFNGMKMMELRKYAKAKNIKTGGKKLDALRKELFKAYSG